MDRGLAGAVLLLGSMGCSVHAATQPKCAGKADGGDWPSYGHDTANTRYQPEETRIGPARVSSLVPVWKATVEGNIHSTPTVAGGCVYVGTAATGQVIAYNADNGAVVWQQKLESGVGIIGAITIDKGRAFVIDSLPGDGVSKGPYLRAFNAQTGGVMWTSLPLTIRAGATTNASPSIFSVPDGSRGMRDVLLVGYFGPTGTPVARAATPSSMPAMAGSCTARTSSPQRTRHSATPALPSGLQPRATAVPAMPSSVPAIPTANRNIPAPTRSSRST